MDQSLEKVIYIQRLIQQIIYHQLRTYLCKLTYTSRNKVL